MYERKKIVSKKNIAWYQKAAKKYCIEEKYCRPRRNIILSKKDIVLKICMAENGQRKFLYRREILYCIKRPRKNTTLKGQVLVHALTTIAPQVVNYELILQFKLLQSPEALRRSCTVKKLQKSD